MDDYFNKVVAGVNRGVKNIKNSSNAFMEKADLKNQINECNKNINSYMINLGNMVYNFYKEGSLIDSRLDAIAKEINSTYEHINELQEKINSLNNTQPQVNVGSGNNFCINCGSPVEAGSNFCVRCGKPLK